MLAALVIAGVVALTVGSVVKRLMDLPRIPWAVWPALALAAASPAYVAWRVLDPGAAVDRAEVHAQRDRVELDVPPGHALMVTARLADVDEDQPNTGKTAYSLHIKGEGWSQGAAGTIRRKTAKAGPDIDVLDGQGIQESGKQRAGRWGEDLQDRVDLDGSGHIEVLVTNWQGLAAEALVLEVVPGPPPAWATWAVVAVLSLVGIWLEVKHGFDKIAGDLAFLGLWAVFLRDGVTPLDDFQRVGYAVLPAALLGWGAVAGLAWLAVKYVDTKRKAEEPAAEEPAPRPARARRRRRRTTPRSTRRGDS